MNNFIKKLTNPGTVMSICMLLGALFMQFGVNVDMNWLKETLTIVCALGVVVGIMNNPETKGIDNPFKVNK